MVYVSAVNEESGEMHRISRLKLRVPKNAARVRKTKLPKIPSVQKKMSFETISRNIMQSPSSRDSRVRTCALTLLLEKSIFFSEMDFLWLANRVL